MLKMTELYYFSPTGGTKKAGESFCADIAETVRTINLGAQNKAPENPASELVVAAAPVFGGRIPAAAAEKLRMLDGTGKKAVTLAVYGVRAYEDALLELNDIMTERGFQVIASAALVAQHSIVPEVGKGRPDTQDIAEIRDFAEKVLDKLNKPDKTDKAGETDKNGKCETGSIHVPGNYPYKAAMNMPVTPVSTESCNQCAVCAAVCPTSAIQVEDGAAVTDAEKCNLCMACVAACPAQARILPPAVQESMNQKLGVLKNVRRENEFFL